MSTFAIVFLCIQVSLVQNVFSQCLGTYGPAIAPVSAAPTLAAPGNFVASGLAYDGLAYPAAGFAGAYPATGFVGTYPAAACGLGAAYGGAGEGNVAVAGELPVAGNTAVAGQVPIMGAVSFSGAIPAAGAVSISGQCACGCNAPYNYLY